MSKIFKLEVCEPVAEYRSIQIEEKDFPLIIVQSLLRIKCISLECIVSEFKMKPILPKMIYHKYLMIP